MGEQSQLANNIVGDKALSKWEDLWIEISGALHAPQPNLRHDVGLVRAKLAGRVMYLLRATEHGKGGIEKALQRIRGKPQTGNASYGAQKLREHADSLIIEVLKVGSDWRAAEVTKELKKAMIKFHDPEWNEPAKMRMDKLRAGELRSV